MDWIFPPGLSLFIQLCVPCIGGARRRHDGPGEGPLLPQPHRQRHRGGPQVGQLVCTVGNVTKKLLFFFNSIEYGSKTLESKLNKKSIERYSVVKITIILCWSNSLDFLG